MIHTDKAIRFSHLQAEQRKHDELAHSDIFFRPVYQRLNHFTLHFAKYQAQLLEACKNQDEKSYTRLVTDSFVISLAAANALDMDLDETGYRVDSRFANRTTCNPKSFTTAVDLVFEYVVAVGKMAKACEAIDHLETYPSRSTLESSIKSLVPIIISLSDLLAIDLVSETIKRWTSIEEQVSGVRKVSKSAASLYNVA